MIRDAVFSPCGRFRHMLRRSWDASRPTVGFICLNPSRAGRELEDASSRKMFGFADRMEFGAYVLGNLFPFVATDPADLKRAGYPRTDDADDWLEKVAIEATVVICGWGAEARGLARPAEVLDLLRRLGKHPMALALTADGIPRHPLMLPYTCRPVTLR